MPNFRIHDGGKSSHQGRRPPNKSAMKLLKILKNAGWDHRSIISACRDIIRYDQELNHDVKNIYSDNNFPRL